MGKNGVEKERNIEHGFKVYVSIATTNMNYKIYTVFKIRETIWSTMRFSEWNFEF